MGRGVELDDSLVLMGRRAVVTGAGRGMGRAIALALARAGADVGVTARTASDLELLVADIQAMDRRATGINALTALTPNGAKIPIHFDTDREAIDLTLDSLALADRGKARVVRAMNPA